MLYMSSSFLRSAADDGIDQPEVVPAPSDAYAIEVRGFVVAYELFGITTTDYIWLMSMSWCLMKRYSHNACFIADLACSTQLYEYNEYKHY